MLYLRRSYGSYLIKWDKTPVFLEIHYVIQRPEVYSLSITVWIWNLNSSTRLVCRLLGSRDEKNSKLLTREMKWAPNVRVHRLVGLNSKSLTFSHCEVNNVRGHFRDFKGMKTFLYVLQKKMDTYTRWSVAYLQRSKLDLPRKYYYFFNTI